MTRCQLLLSLLEDAGERGITTSEILEAGVGSRYGARLMELRKAGHSITSERVREGSWRYTLDVEMPAPNHSGEQNSLGEKEAARTPNATVGRESVAYEANADLSALIRDLTDEGECWFDHHGYCQEHGWMETDPPCPHSRAKALEIERQAALKLFESAA